MNVVLTTMLAFVVATAAIQAQQQATPPGTPAKPPQVETPKPAASSARTFTASTGIIINAVRPERVADFEKVIGYLQAALSSSTHETVRAQGKGWRVLKAAEAGPNGSVLYVFLLDPTVPGADYGLGRILAEAYPDTTKLQEIWKLYTDSLASGGSLLSLIPVEPPPPSVTPEP